MPHTAYSAAKFAVKGFTEALITDLRMSAPHVKVSVVMPGHVGTSIAHNSMMEFGRNPKDLTDDQVLELRDAIAKRGVDVSGASDEDLRDLMALRVDMFENNALKTAEEAAKIILDGVRAGHWRILIGPDAHALDVMLRERPHDGLHRGVHGRARRRRPLRRPDPELAPTHRIAVHVPTSGSCSRRSTSWSRQICRTNLQIVDTTSGRASS